MPQTDYRKPLYDSYVSSFNQANATLNEADLVQFYRWGEARYFPHLQHLPKDAAILELGCGHGRMLSYLKQKGFTNVTGIDLSAEQIALAQARGLNALEADVFEYLKNNSFSYDAILAIDFVEHFTKQELLELFELLRAALKPNGILLLQTPNGEGLFSRQIIYGDLTHQTIFTPSSLSQLLRLEGFEPVAITETAPLSNGLKGILRTIIWSIVRFRVNLLRKIEAGKTQKVWTENFICLAKKIR